MESKCTSLIFSILTFDSQILPPYIVSSSAHLIYGVHGLVKFSSWHSIQRHSIRMGRRRSHPRLDLKAPHPIRRRDSQPSIALIFDGHRPHLSTRITKLATENRVELVCLPPHSTAVLQPLDVVGLTKVKTAWRQLFVTLNTRTNSRKIEKRRFSYSLKRQCPKRRSARTR